MRFAWIANSIHDRMAKMGAKSLRKPGVEGYIIASKDAGELSMIKYPLIVINQNVVEPSPLEILADLDEGLNADSQKVIFSLKTSFDVPEYKRYVSDEMGARFMYVGDMPLSHRNHWFYELTNINK